MEVIDFVRFGTPTIEQVNTMAKSDLLDDVFAKFSDLVLPKNGSNQILKDLQNVSNAVNSLKENEKELGYYRAIDKNLYVVFQDWCARRGFETENLKDKLEPILIDVNALIYKLKYHYQRIRPKQLAELLGVDTFLSYGSTSADSPSFPSGHSLQICVLGGLLQKAKPELSNAIEEFANQVMRSRFVMGLHFKHDIDIAKEISQEILGNVEFRRKYEDEEIFISKMLMP
jgi:hypothetical protein